MLGGLVGVGIVVLLPQRQPPLTDGEDIVLGVFLVGTDVEAEQAAHTLAEHGGPHLLQPLGSHLGRTAVAVYAQESLHLVQSVLLQGSRVHGGVVEVGYLLFD